MSVEFDSDIIIFLLELLDIISEIFPISLSEDALASIASNPDKTSTSGNSRDLFSDWEDLCKEGIVETETPFDFRYDETTERTMVFPLLDLSDAIIIDGIDLTIYFYISVIKNILALEKNCNLK